MCAKILLMVISDETYEILSFIPAIRFVTGNGIEQVACHPGAGKESDRVSYNESLHPCDISVISNKYHIAILGNLRWFSIFVDWKKVSGCKNIVS